MSSKYSSNDKTHPYLRGFLFWDKNRYWHKSNLYSEKTRKQMDAWVDSMRMNDRQLTNIDPSITNI